MRNCKRNPECLFDGCKMFEVPRKKGYHDVEEFYPSDEEIERLELADLVKWFDNYIEYEVEEDSQRKLFRILCILKEEK